MSTIKVEQKAIIHNLYMCTELGRDFLDSMLSRYGTVGWNAFCYRLRCFDISPLVSCPLPRKDGREMWGSCMPVSVDIRLDGEDFSGLNFSDMHFVLARMTDCNFRGSVLDLCTFGWVAGSSFVDANLLEYDRERKGYYYTDRNWFLPAISLSEGDLYDLLVASRALEQYDGTPVARELERIFSKIAELMPEKISIRPELVFSKFSFTAPPSKPVNEKTWITIVRGLQNQRTVKVRYRPFGTDRSVSQKWSRINPYHVANLQGEWYVFAVHSGYEDVRQFAMPRIDEAKLTDRRFAMPETFDARALLSGAFGRYAGGNKEHRVRLLFDKDIAEWITERRWHPKQKLKHRRNGHIELSFPAKGLFEVQRWVLSWGHHVKVLAPKELKTMVEEEIKRMASV